MGACIITWMPSLVLMVFDIYYVIENSREKMRSLLLVVWPWVDAVAFTSSAINPLIYYLRNQDFRQAFRRTFRWLPCGFTE